MYQSIDKFGPVWNSFLEMLEITFDDSFQCFTFHKLKESYVSDVIVTCSVEVPEHPLNKYVSDGTESSPASIHGT